MENQIITISIVFNYIKMVLYFLQSYRVVKALAEGLFIMWSATTLHTKIIHQLKLSHANKIMKKLHSVLNTFPNIKCPLQQDIL